MHAPFDEVGVLSVLSRQSPKVIFRVRIVLKKKIAKISLSLDGTLEDGLKICDHFVHKIFQIGRLLSNPLETI